MKDVTLLTRCNEEFAMKTRQRNSYSEGTVTALAAVFLASCLWPMGSRKGERRLYCTLSGTARAKASLWASFERSEPCFGLP